jgi:hypothetical protein
MVILDSRVYLDRRELVDTNRFADFERLALDAAFFRFAGAARLPDFERPR